MVGGRSPRYESGREPSQRFVSGRGMLPKVQKLSGDPPVGPESIEGRSWRSGSGQGTLLEVPKWSGDHHKGPEVVEGPSQRSGSGRGTLP